MPLLQHFQILFQCPHCLFNYPQIGYLNARDTISPCCTAEYWQDSGLPFIMTLPKPVHINITVNQQLYQLQTAPWVSLLDALRDTLSLTGTKKGCDHGQCGACTVLCNGERILSCLTLAVMKNNASITTIEGVGNPQLHPLQAAFIDHDAFQCGYCTPGQICSAIGMLQEGKAHTRDEIKEAMSGNLCRCGANTNIIDAIMDVKGKVHESL